VNPESMGPEYAPEWLWQETDVKVEKLTDGIKLCLSNSQNFLMEADILMGNKHFRHCIGLLELAMEEMGKAQHIVDVFEDSIVAGVKTTSLVKGVFKRHAHKLAFTPKPFVRSYSRQEKDLRQRFYSSGPELREKSFYVDFAQGQWVWGTPELERKDTITFLIREMQIDCEFIEGRMKNALTVRETVEKHGFDDKRTQESMRKYFGRLTSSKQASE
jgi:AbiV family abortive infection protein